MVKKYKRVSNAVLIDGMLEFQKTTTENFTMMEKLGEMRFDTIRNLEKAARKMLRRNQVILPPLNHDVK